MTARGRSAMGVLTLVVGVALGARVGAAGGLRPAGSALPAASAQAGARLSLPMALRAARPERAHGGTSTAQAGLTPSVGATTPQGTVPAPPETVTPEPTARPVDECDRMAPEWLFCDGFERGAPWDGQLRTPEVAADPGPFDLAGNRVARLRVPAGAGGTGLWKSLPGHDRLYARWYVRWEAGHDLAARHHGPGGLGADVSWYTGRSGIRPNGDEYFVASLEPAASEPHVVYSYTYSRGMYMDCADPNGRCWGDLFPCYAGPRYCTRPQHLPRVEQAGVEPGRWYCLEQMVDAGTPVREAGLADGVLDFWIDGVQIGPWTDLWWRTVPELQVNFLWLYLYHHGEHSVEGIELDNVVASSARIGCGR